MCRWYSTALVIREMQNSLNSISYSLDWQKLEKLITLLFGKDVKEQELSTLLMEIKIAETLKSRLCVSLHSTIHLLGVVPGETSCAHKKMGTRMYTATWLVTAKAWILPKYPLTVDSINYGYSHAIKYYIGAKMGTFF